MQVTETSTEGLKREFRVVVPASDLSDRVTERLTQMKDQVKINGFRPGKVPVAHLKRVYGRAVMAETIEQLVRETNAKIVSDRGLKLAMDPKITMTEDKDEIEGVIEGKTDLAYTVAVEVVPPITLADFKSVTLERVTAPVSDQEIDDALGKIAAQNRPYAAKPEGSTAENGRPGDDLVRRLDRRRAVRRRHWRRRARHHRLGDVHSRLRGPARRHRARREPHGQRHLPGELQRREARRQSGRIRGDGEVDRGARPGERRRSARDLARPRIARQAARGDQGAYRPGARHADAGRSSSARSSTSSTPCTSSRRRRPSSSRSSTTSGIRCSPTSSRRTAPSRTKGRPRRRRARSTTRSPTAACASASCSPRSARRTTSRSPTRRCSAR